MSHPDHTPFGEDSDAKDVAENRTPSRSRSRYWGEWAGILVAALVIAAVLRTFVFQTFWIPSESMENTLLIGDRVIVNKLEYRFGDVERGDIVVFKRPPNEPDPTIKDLVKRVIGLPGDVVVARDGLVYVNNEAIDEPYLKQAQTTVTGLENPITVPSNEVFVMGDNRLNSQDGRVFGTFSQDLIVGKAAVRIWPLDRFTYFSN